MKIAIGNDRKGLGYKEAVVVWLLEKGYEVVNVGTDVNEPCDYPIYAEKVARLVSSGECEKGIVICASGIGISIAANKVKGIRCGVGYCDEVAKAMRLHNDANIIAFGQDYMSLEDVIKRVKVFLDTDFLGSYHLDRVKQISELEKNNSFNTRNEVILKSEMWKELYMGLKEIFKKQGGMRLLKQYWQGGALFTGIGEFLLLGKSRTALEILRLSTSLKTKQKLERKYRWKLNEFDRKYVEKEHKMSNKIWICWFQGMENAPELVRKCYKSVVENNPNSEVIVITTENMFEYVKFPDYVVEKWKKGEITHTHMTDLMRLELLITYGGLWLDATVFCTGKAPDYFFNSNLFFYQCLKPGRDGHGNFISSWLINAKTNNKVLMATRDLCYEYWKTNDSMWDYFLFHDLLCIALERYEDEWKKIIPRDNATPHLLLLRLFDQYNEQMWNAIKSQTQFHKLTYKFDQREIDKKDTFYKCIFEDI